MKRLLIPVAALTPVLVAVLLMVLFAPATAFSQNNPPPAGSSLTPPSVQILDLSGQPLPGGGNGETYVQYTADFTATQTNATITFAFRDDPADLSFANVSVVDVTADSAVPLANNDFSQGTVGSTPTSWTWTNVSGTGSEGVVQTGPSYCYTELDCWYDGSSQGYDTISQAITTVAGHNYQISFFWPRTAFAAPMAPVLLVSFPTPSHPALPELMLLSISRANSGGTPNADFGPAGRRYGHCNRQCGNADSLKLLRSSRNRIPKRRCTESRNLYGHLSGGNRADIDSGTERADCNQSPVYLRGSGERPSLSDPGLGRRVLAHQDEPVGVQLDDELCGERYRGFCCAGSELLLRPLTWVRRPPFLSMAASRIPAASIS